MTPRQELEALVDVFTPRLRDAFLAAIYDIVDNVILEDVIRAIRDGDIERAIAALGFSEAAMRPLTRELEAAYETGGVLTGRTFPRYLNTASGRGVFRFDVRNMRAEAYLRDTSSTLITSIEEDMRSNVRTALTGGMRRGDNPRTTALEIVGRYDAQAGHRVGGLVGLTEQQVGWLRGFENSLMTLDERYFKYTLRDKRFDPVVRRAIDEGRPLSASDISRMSTRYKDAALKWRGDMIARTESMQALNASEYEATKQVVEMGAVPPERVKRAWDATGDRRTRRSHSLMDGQIVGIDEAFVSPVTGGRLMFPGDTSLDAPASEIINCRCRQRMQIQWIADSYGAPVPLRRTMREG